MPDHLALLIAKNLRLASDHLDDAVHGHDRKRARNAPYHLFMATELTLLAVMASEGLSTLRRDTQHQLDAMARSLPDENPTKAHFLKIASLTAYATTYRYAKPSGDASPGMEDDDFTEHAEAVEKLIRVCAKWFGVEDMRVSATTPAARTRPLRSAAPQPGDSPKP